MLRELLFTGDVRRGTNMRLGQKRGGVSKPPKFPKNVLYFPCLILYLRWQTLSTALLTINYCPLGSFQFVPPPPQLQSTCYYIVNHCVKIWHVRLRGGGGGGGGGGYGTNENDLTPQHFPFSVKHILRD